MIIDFHTHIFPDKIAQKTIDHLSQIGGIPYHSDATATGLVSHMEEAGIDISVTLPVITNPSQFDSINRFAKQINQEYANKKRRLISFAGIHPDCEDIDGKMAFIAKSGFLGVKIHPDYQGTYINDENYVRIMECAREYDLIVVTHAGVDVAFPDVHCPPELALELIRRVPHSKLVLAHMGANMMPDGVLERLCGEDVYFDTAYVLRFIGEEIFKKILRAHGEDRILFATDSPWSDIRGDVEILNSFDLNNITKEKIFCENAKKLLKI
ncbi:MAG: metal-dependent hydrolase [Ruminococcaceae bacterium]|nr:metal-dependent hydrolase [Oscillospiraceae bacterium]